MLNTIIDVIKKILVSAFIIYGYNVLVVPLNLNIPINIITILMITIFGIPSLFSFSIILLLVY
jgi:hypothetical protein